ncbi:amino acid adenylation domain-containing protein [Streptomyces sp. NPDC004031]
MSATQRAGLPLAPGTAARAAARAATNPRAVDLGGTVAGRVRARAAAAPDHEAIVSGTDVVDYARLVRDADRLAAQLRDAGCGPGWTVACLGRRSALTPVLFLAVEQLGAVYLPVDPSWPRARRDDVLLRSGSALLADCTGGGVALTVLRPDGGGAAAGPGLPGEPPPRYVIFTSGTTGRPKGAVVSQPGMLNHLHAKILDLGLTARDRVAFTAPLAFDISVWQMLAPLMAGGTVVVADDNDVTFPPRLHRLLTRHGATVVELVPTAIAGLLDEAERRGPAGALPRLRWLVSTGEELRPGLARRALDTLPGTALLNAYGPTECSDDVTHHVVTRGDLAATRLPVGRPIANAEIHCLRREPGSDRWRCAEDGEAGEVFVGGVPVGLGYVGDGTTTRESFFGDTLGTAAPDGRLYRTGDLGRLEGGVLHYLGRADRQVKVSGVRLELDEVEAVLSTHPAVGHCAVTAPGEGGRPGLVAWYVARAPVAAGELEAHLRAVLPPAAVPQRWRAVAALPLTPNGKVDHASLTAGAVDDAPR